jgi:hypothetical protein
MGGLLTIIGLLTLLIFSVLTMNSIFSKENFTVHLSDASIGVLNTKGLPPNSGNYYCPSQPCVTESVLESMERILPKVGIIVSNCKNCKCSNIEVSLRIRDNKGVYNSIGTTQMNEATGHENTCHANLK